MKRFIEGEDRKQITLLPESLDEYVAEDNPVRVVDVFVDELDLAELGFGVAAPATTGRPSYHPSVLLKIYIYGYLNRIQSSRRLERETQRNLALIWLAGRLMPDFKTIADFRKDNGAAIRRVCREFIVLCRSLNLFSEAIVAIDGSKFKAVNNRDKNFTDIVRYNVQTAVDAKHHLIVAHEVTNLGHDRTQLSSMAQQASQAIGEGSLTVLADRGYFSSGQIRECEQSGIEALVPKPLTSNSKAAGRFDKRDFIYIAKSDEYQCPAGQRAIRRFTTVENGLTLHKYWSSACPQCKLKAQCTTSIYRRIARREHEDVLERMQKRLDRTPEASKLRRQTVEHTFGTLKAWMGATHFLTKTLPRVSAEMSLNVLAYNLKRMMRIFGAKPLMKAMTA